MEKQLNIRVFGRVQGVWFRQTTKDKAIRLNIRGIVMNEEDGSVFICALGEDKDLEIFLKYCKIGPKASVVSNVVVEEVEPQDFNDFRILH